ncbi:MAG: hypothetical protein KDB27_17275, partial [Planctomycetales bacterium]|nr:hypothetical protein [Planctomycetales bacterium]
GGTAGYIAPELLCGGNPSPASDIYSLGVFLFTLVTGKLPKQSGKACVGALAPASTIINGCLQNDPRQRIQATAELKAEIAACLTQLNE